MAWRNKLPNKDTGKFGIHFKPSRLDLELFPLGEIAVPCGKCIGCIDDRRKNWVNRLMYEMFVAGCGTFLTLTYKDAPFSPSKRDCQNFIKRLRNVERDFGIHFPPNFKYFLVAERGSTTQRPHYHACLYGVDMFERDWKPYIATIKNGYPVYASRIIEKLWPHGFNVVGSLTPSSCRYVAKYCVKDIADDSQSDTFSLKSLSIGAEFFFYRRRAGRKIHYSPKPQTIDLMKAGCVHLPSGHANPITVGIPKSFVEILDRIGMVEDYEDIRICRQLDGIRFARHFNIDDYIEVLKDRKNKQKHKEIIK